MPVGLPKGLVHKTKQEAAELRESDGNRKGSESSEGPSESRDGARSSSSESTKSLSELRDGTDSTGAFEESKEGKRREEESGGGAKGAGEYEFTVWEDRILEVVMEAMRMAGLALSVRAIATFCLGAPTLALPFRQ